jgi:hypothetical protein
MRSKIFVTIEVLILIFSSGCLAGADSGKDGLSDDVGAVPIEEVPIEEEHYLDSDGDGYADEDDAFPNDRKYHLDSDGDGYADEVDDFPNDRKYHLDSDDDGYADEVDAFPNDNKYHLDSDGDGYADEVDDFPKDGRYHSDYDKDGYADEVDSFKSDSRYHATCSVCDGNGHVYSDHICYIEYTKNAHYENRGVFNPDYYQYVTVTNIDSHDGTFEVYAYATDNGVKMWEETKKNYIAPGNSYEFVFHYDADEDMDSFHSSVTPPTYTETIKNTCTECNGAGKI